MKDVSGLRRVALGLAAAPLLLALSACNPGSARYTLYKHGAVTADMTQEQQAKAAKARVHVATFNAHSLEARNEDNCRVAAELFSGRAEKPGSYWCEMGPYHP